MGFPEKGDICILGMSVAGDRLWEKAFSAEDMGAAADGCFVPLIPHFLLGLAL